MANREAQGVVRKAQLERKLDRHDTEIADKSALMLLRFHEEFVQPYIQRQEELAEVVAVAVNDLTARIDTLEACVAWLQLPWWKRAGLTVKRWWEELTAPRPLPEIVPPETEAVALEVATNEPESEVPVTFEEAASDQAP